MWRWLDIRLPTRQTLSQATSGANRRPGKRCGRITPVKTRVPFRLRGVDGVIEVVIDRSTAAEDTGLCLLDGSLSANAGVGLPICTATVEYSGRGYAAAMGWVQLVRSTDSDDPGVFEPDPLAMFREVNTPYAFFGIRPTLFDAPYRPITQDLRWRARSYLAVTDDAVMSRAARPIAAFTWGFTIESGRVNISSPVPLPTDTWSAHIPTLARAYPNWQF